MCASWKRSAAIGLSCATAALIAMAPSLSASLINARGCPATQSRKSGSTRGIPVSETPAALGYRMPAEWEPHEATWIAWPHNRSDWPGKFAAIPWVYAEIVRHLGRVEGVHILVNDAAAEKQARQVLNKSNVALDRIVFHLWPTNRGWTRDYGAILLKSGEPHDSGNSRRGQAAVAQLTAVNWRFNGWAKYSDWGKDDEIASRMAKYLRLREWQPSVNIQGKLQRVVLEGGSIEVNGRGTMLATEECLLSAVQGRNPGIDRAELEEIFREYLGVTKVLWLEKGIAGDDTHGHIDDVARFVSENTFVVAVEKNTSDPNHKPLRDNLARLRSMSDQDGRALRIVELPMPAHVIFRGQRLPASYANFYIANGLVLVPTFNDANDRTALNILAELFPDRDMIGIYCGDLVWGLGAIHCMTQQEPAP